MTARPLFAASAVLLIMAVGSVLAGGIVGSDVPASTVAAEPASLAPRVAAAVEGIGGAAAFMTGEPASVTGEPASELRCYFQSNMPDGFDGDYYTTVAEAAPASDGKVASDGEVTTSAALETCAAMWKQGFLTHNGVRKPADDADAPGQRTYDIPHLAVCQLHKRIAVVFPDGPDTCKDHGLDVYLHPPGTATHAAAPVVAPQPPPDPATTPTVPSSFRPHPPSSGGSQTAWPNPAFPDTEHPAPGPDPATIPTANPAPGPDPATIPTANPASAAIPPAAPFTGNPPPATPR